MPHSEEEPHCQKFEPNIFDSSRCHSCLRTRKQHFGAPVQEDSDGLSVVTGYCDVTRDRLGYEDGSLCILSPDCALYVCDEENSTTSTQDHSDYPELSGSITSEEDYLQLQDTEPRPTMTRLDPPLHRPRPSAWMDEPRGREGFSRSSGSREDRERESGYFSLGRASGVRSLRDMSPSPPFRHTEVGRPLPSTRSPEPKATIPFRNPDLGVPSQRRSLDIEGSDSLPAGSDLPVSHRCLSPTPFKVAESLDSPNRKRVDSSYSASHHTTSRHLSQTGRPSSAQRGGPSPSRSSSPSRGTSPFRRTESAGSSHRQNFDSTPFTQRSSQRSGSPSQNSYGRDADSGGLRGNLKRGYDTSLLRKSTNSDARSSESSFLRIATSVAKADSNPANLRKTNHKDARSDASTSPGSWRGSALSLRSPPTSRSSSPAGRDKGPKVPANTLKFVRRSTNESSSRTKTGHSRPGLEPRSPSPECRRSSSRTRSPSPQRRRHESSQSSLSESESSHISAGSAAVGFNREEYALMADLPKVKTIFQREGAGQQERGPSSSPVREERYKPASHSREKPRYWDRDESGERGRGRERRDGQEAAGGFVQSHSAASVHTPMIPDDRVAGYFSSRPTDDAEGQRPEKANSGLVAFRDISIQRYCVKDIS
ncbi:hypothetical protein GJAV_G00226210 [Gymnothorax javanicus]|nr:hypothetical protein GJAV_G00226210 [Gymnothorax javanicus]